MEHPKRSPKGKSTERRTRKKKATDRTSKEHKDKSKETERTSREHKRKVWLPEKERARTEQRREQATVSYWFWKCTSCTTDPRCKFRCTNLQRCSKDSVSTRVLPCNFSRRSCQDFARMHELLVMLVMQRTCLQARCLFARFSQELARRTARRWC